MRKKILVLGVMLAVLLGGVFYSLTMKILQRDKIMPSLASEIVLTDLMTQMEICGTDMPKSKSKIYDYKHNLLYGLARSVYVYQEVKPYANLADVNGDGLPDYLYAYYEPIQNGESYCLSLLMNKGENKFEIGYNCYYNYYRNEQFEGYVYRGTCADPNDPL